MFQWFGPIKRPEVYKLWTLMILFFGRVYSLARQNYTRQFSIESIVAELEAEGEFVRKPEAVNKRRPSEFVIWQWHGFPKLWHILMIYEQFTTCFMLYIVAKHTMTQQLEQLIGYLFNSLISLPPNCWLIGHTQGHASFNAYAAVTISLCHLAWRASISYTQRPYVFDAYLFLLISDHDLEQFYTLLAQQLTLNDQVDGQVVTLTATTTPAQVEATDSNSNRIDQLDSPSGRFLRSLLCYKIEHKSRVVYKLRPNRTSGARASLRRLASFMFVFVGAFFLLGNLIIWSLIAMFLLTDRRYLLTYPKCSPHLEQRTLNNSGALATARWSLSLTSGHEVLATSLDLVENYFLWFDSTAALILVGGASIYLLNYDALLYWRQLDQKLHLTYARVRTNYLRHHPLAPPNFHHATRHQSLATIEDDSEPEAEVEEGWPTSGTDTPTPPLNGFLTYNSRLYRHELELENAILELQTEFSDFFRHIELIDLFISDVISAAIIIWLLNFSVFGHFLFNPQVYERDIRLLWVVISMEIFGLIVMTGISSCLLEVNQLCTKSYQCICSLMAYDQSKHKREFLKLLEYFTVKKRSAYTLFQHYPYTKTTYLSIFGWALSCFFVADGIYKR